SHITAQPDLWSEMVSPPILVSKTNVMIGYNPIYEYAALPDVDRIVAAIRRSASIQTSRGEARMLRDRKPAAIESAKATPKKVEMPKGHVQSITVPVMGEGIRNAKIVSLLKKPGDPIALDDDLCEVETDKAVYPIQSSCAGTLREWNTKVGDTVEIGQELGTILTADVSSDGAVEAAIPSREPPESAREDTRRYSKPALSPTITRKLNRVIPANLQIDARWDAIHLARETVKKKN